MSTTNNFGGEDWIMWMLVSQYIYNRRLVRPYQPGAPELHWGHQEELNPICYLPWGSYQEIDCKGSITLGRLLRKMNTEAALVTPRSLRIPLFTRKVKPRSFSQAQTHQPTQGSNTTLGLGRHCVSPSNIIIQALTDALPLALTTPTPWPVCAFVNWPHDGKP